MNVMLKSYFNNFIDSNELSEYSDDESFEKFCNYYLVNQHYPQDFDLDSCSIGGGDDSGIDGICIIIDDIFIRNILDLKKLYTTTKKIDVKFIFNQSKNSEKFDLGGILKFLSGIRLFFNEN
ncbi:hypothetical protein J7S50_21900, partial [Providencia rettgeri]|nr:hypothetical protein [Providencia rettgeri]